MARVLVPVDHSVVGEARVAVPGTVGARRAMARWAGGQVASLLALLHYWCILGLLLYSWHYTWTCTLLHYCTTALLHYCTTALLHYCTTAPLHYCTIALLHYCTTALLHYCTTAPPQADL